MSTYEESTSYTSIEQWTTTLDDVTSIVGEPHRFAIFYAEESANLESAFVSAAEMIHEKFDFVKERLELKLYPFLVTVMYKEDEQFILIGYETEKVSVVLIQDSLESEHIFSIVELLNGATFSLWEPVELTLFLVAALLAGYRDDEFVAQINLDYGLNCESRLELSNKFVVNTLKMTSIEGLDQAISLVVRRIEEAVAKIKLGFGRIISLDIKDKVVFYANDPQLRFIKCDDAIKISAYMCEVIELETTKMREKLCTSWPN